MGVLGALWLYAKQRDERETSVTQDQHESLYRRLRAELDANRQIISRSVATIESVLQDQPLSIGNNDPIHAEGVYLAPLFADSWKALAETDAHRIIPRGELDQLFDYYAAVSRANWLITRAQRFQFRVPILEQILATLREVDDEKTGYGST